VYEEEISDVLIHARYLINSFHVAVRVPPEILGMISSSLTEEDSFSASQVCHHWRSVLISSPSLWTRVSCRNVPRTIVSLERCKSLPIQLQLEPPFSPVALEDVLLHGNGIASLTISHEPNRILHLQQLFVFSRPSVERLHIYFKTIRGWRIDEQSVHEIWQDLPSLRELFVHRYSIPIEQLNAPNLAHLALEHTGYGRDVTVQSILETLRECPLLETLLITHSCVSQDQIFYHSPVCLPKLRSIELGSYEVRCGLILHLQFPPDVIVGFRVMLLKDVYGDVPMAVTDPVQHVLGRIDIRCITLAASPHHEGGAKLLVRFEGLRGSLEISTCGVYTRAEPQNVLFDPRGVLFSHSPRIENVRELHLVGCSFIDGQAFHHINAAMPDLVSISFFRCKGANLLGLLARANPSLPPFPQLERIMVLGSGSGLRRIAKIRKDRGVPLKTVVVGQGPTRTEYNHPEDYAELGELVDDLRVGCHTEILKWGTGNEISNIWSGGKIPSPVSPN